jgi:hypothetical protein
MSVRQISSSRIVITRNNDGGMKIHQVGRFQASMNLDGDEWLDLVALVLAVKAADDYEG